jgi:uncharacterized peroxidase-related enzyme
MINEPDATGPLGALYKRFGNPDGTVDNVLKVHSLNPESLRAHCALYVQSMHRPGPLTRAEREMVGVTVSRLNGCEYCREHHARGLARLLPADRKGVAEAVRVGDLSKLSERERAMCSYAAKLTLDPASVARPDVEALREAGLTDREVLDVAQVAAYFAYANRIALGLGAELEHTDRIGQWPHERA